MKSVKLHKAHKNEFNEITELEAPEPPIPKKEGTMKARGTNRTANPSADVNDAAIKKLFAKDIAKKIIESLDSAETEEIILMIPAELCHKVKSGLQKIHLASIVGDIDKDLAKAPLPEILERIMEIKKAP